MSKFNWQLASVVELAQHIKVSKEESIRQHLLYYKKTCNKAMIDKVLLAKKYVTLWKLEEQVLCLRKELYD